MDDPYVYPGTQVLINKENIHDGEALAQFERLMTRQRMEEPLPVVALSYDGYRQLHHHLFQDVYDWAGQERTVELSKGSDPFCRPAFIQAQMDQRFAAVTKDFAKSALTREQFTEKCAEHICEINAIHPFREGNGRTQRALLETLGRQAGYQVALDRIDAEAWKAASVRSFRERNYEPMREVIAGAIEPQRDRSIGREL